MSSMTRITVDEDDNVVQAFDAIAEQHGGNRTALMRWAIRYVVFSSPTVPNLGKFAKKPGRPKRVRTS